jgi:hypothetical protein
MKRPFQCEPKRFKGLVLSISLTVAGLLAPLPLLAQPQSCAGIYFHEAAAHRWQPLLHMDPAYVGEDRGMYVDPRTNMRWNVKYFGDETKKEFEVFINKDGLVVDRAGQPVSTEFDRESLQFEHALFVIDADLRIYVMNLDERGKFHHTSITHGQPIIFAGSIGLMEGKIREISDESGHYKPSVLQSLIAIRTLHLMGANMGNMKLRGIVLPQTLLHTYSMTADEVQTSLRALFEKAPLTVEQIQALIPTKP